MSAAPPARRRTASRGTRRRGRRGRARPRTGPAWAPRSPRAQCASPPPRRGRSRDASARRRGSGSRAVPLGVCRLRSSSRRGAPSRSRSPLRRDRTTSMTSRSRSGWRARIHSSRPARSASVVANRAGGHVPSCTTMSTLGPLVPADETFNHQIVDTFATVGADRPRLDREGLRDGVRARRLPPARLRPRQVHEPWRHGRLRGRVDGRPAVDGAGEPRARARPRHHEHRARSTTRWSSRTGRCGSRSSPTTRSRSASSGCFRSRASHRCSSAHEQHRGADGYRLDADIVRYHQIGVGERMGRGGRRARRVRRHVLGLDPRPLVGRALHGGRARSPTCPSDRCPTGLSILTIWSPMLCERADGSRYGLHLYYQRHSLGSFRRLELAGRRRASRRAPGGLRRGRARPPLRRHHPAVPRRHAALHACPTAPSGRSRCSR